jgi:O-antigen/teichoic acid export membrane protein
MEDDLTKVAQGSARGGFFLMSGTALSTVILAVASVLIARLLGPELYGQYSLALVVPQLLYLFTDLGINQGITKFTAAMQSEGKANRVPTIIKHGLLVKTIVGFAISAINYAFAGVIAAGLLQRPDLAFYIQLAAISILFQVVFATATSAFVGLDKTEYSAITMNIQAIAKTVLSIALVFAGLSISGAVAGYTISYIITAVSAIPLLWLILRTKKKPAESIDLKTDLKALFQYGTPLYISTLLAGFLPLLTNVILAFFTTDAAIGNYKAATNFATLLTVLAVPITTVLLPAFSKLGSSGGQKIRDFFRIVVKYTTIVIVPVTFLVIIFSEEIVQIIYGGTYASASLFLSTFCLQYFLVGIGFLSVSSLFNGLGETKTTLKMNLMAFLILTLLTVPLTQLYGVQGAIAAFLIAWAAATVYGGYEARRKFHVEYGANNLVRVYLISALSCAAPLLISRLASLDGILDLAVGGLIYLFSYVTLIPLTSVVTSSEIQQIALATQDTPLLRQIAKPLLNYQQRIIQLKTTPKKQQSSDLFCTS